VSRVFVVIRFRVAEGEQGAFAERVRVAVEVLAKQKGFVSARVGRNVDDPELLALDLEWVNVGSYRRALSPYDVKMAAVPLLSEAIDEPTAYEDLLTQHGFDSGPPGPIAWSLP
jgi:quinol monooxygenase YgiN